MIVSAHLLLGVKYCRVYHFIDLWRLLSFVAKHLTGDSHGDCLRSPLLGVKYRRIYHFIDLWRLLSFATEHLTGDFHDDCLRAPFIRC